MIMTSDPTRVGLKPTELILIPVQELTSDPTRVGLKLSGEITDWNRSVSSDPTRVGLKPTDPDSYLYVLILRPHEGWSETGDGDVNQNRYTTLRPHEGWSETMPKVAVSTSLPGSNRLTTQSTINTPQRCGCRQTAGIINGSV